VVEVKEISSILGQKKEALVLESLPNCYRHLLAYLFHEVFLPATSSPLDLGLLIGLA
jgi:hypothetical protein